MDNNGRIISGGKICTYQSSTFTPQATFTSNAGTVQNSNPIILDSAGRANVWFGNGLTYRVVLQQPGNNFCPGTGAQIWSQDGVQSSENVAGSVQIFENSPATNGGYIDFTPITYNPYDSPTTCFDIYGNVVQQPLPATGLPAFGSNDIILWNSTSPLMPASGSCGVPFPVNENYGLNLNAYLFAMGGLSTSQTSFNSIQTFTGGVQAASYVAGGIYVAGTTVCTIVVSGVCTMTEVLGSDSYLGGHVDVGHSCGPPMAGTITTASNPFTVGEGNVAGQLYWDDCLMSLQVYNGSAFETVGSGGGGGGAPGGPTDSIQYNAGSGMFGGNGALGFGTSSGILSVCVTLGGICSATSGVQAQAFSSSATGAATAYTDGVGNFTIQGNGNASFQNVTVHSVFNSDADVTGGNAFQTSGGTMTISGSGNIAAQSLAVTNGITVDSGTYGLNGVGALTVASCSGCTIQVFCVAAGTNTLTCPGSPVPVSYTVGMTVNILIANNNTGATTLNINSLGAAAVLSGGAALTSGAFMAGEIYTLYYDGTNFNIGSSTGGVNSFNTRTGAVILLKSDVTTVDQALGVADSPTFAGVTAGIFNCTDTGGTACVQQSTGTFVITGAGNMTAQSLGLTNGITTGSGSFGLTGTGVLTVNSCTGCGGSAAGSNTQLQYNTLGVFGASSNFTVNAGTGVLTASGGMVSAVFNCTATGTADCLQQQSGTFTILGNGSANFQNLVVQSASTFNGGLTTGSASNSDLFVGTGGNFYNRATGASTGVSCSGIGNGWTAITSDDFVVVCLGSARFRAALVSY